MTDAQRRKAAQTAEATLEVTGHTLPEPEAGVVAFEDAPPAKAAEMERRIAELDLTDTQSIVMFGAAAQEKLQEISQSMLADVRNKDLGPAGDSLREIVAAIRGFSVTELDTRRKRTLWERLSGRAAPMARFAARFEDVQGQIDRITDNLLTHEHKLLKDIRSLDILYDRTLEFYDELGLYIAAGEEKLARIDRDDLPAKKARVDAAPKEHGVMMAQELRDLRAARDDLERRVHDLKLTRQVTMQSLPSIRLVQENDKSLVTKINSTLVNTVPAVGDAARAGGDDPPLRRGRGRGARGHRPHQRPSDRQCREPARRQPRGPAGDGARRVRHRGGEGRQCRADRHHRGKPADRRRGPRAAREGRGRPPDAGAGAEDRALRGSGPRRPHRRSHRQRRPGSLGARCARP